MSMPVVLVTGGYDHKIKYWDATSGVCSKSINCGEHQINCLQISGDKSLVAAGCNPLIQLFDNFSMEERPVLSFDGHSTNVTSIGFQKEQKWLYSGSEDGTVKIWDPRSSSHTKKYDCGSAVNTVALHPNQTELISGDQNGYVRMWDIVADKCREEYKPASEMPVRSISIAYDASLMVVGSHRGRLLAYTPSKTAGSWDVSKDFRAHDDYLLKCLISPDLKTVATTSADKTVKLWSTGMGGTDDSLEERNSDAAEDARAVSGSDAAAVEQPMSKTSSSSTGGADDASNKDLSISDPWDVQLTMTKHQRWVWDCVFSADSLYLLTASSDMSAKLWDLKSGDVIRNFVGHGLAVTCVALNDYSMI